MTLTVETGSASSTADAYISRADATTYHANRGNSAWTDLGTDDQDAAIRRATDYLGQTYRMRWAGYRVTSTQALDWPRTGVPMVDVSGGYRMMPYHPVDSVPTEVVNACAELALRAASGPLAPDQGQAIASVKAGSVEVSYADYSTASKTYPAIDRLLAPLLTGGGSTRLMRS